MKNVMKLLAVYYYTILVVIVTVTLMSSCGSTHNACAAYASVEVENNNN